MLSLSIHTSTTCCLVIKEKQIQTSCFERQIVRGRRGHSQIRNFIKEQRYKKEWSHKVFLITPNKVYQSHLSMHTVRFYIPLVWASLFLLFLSCTCAAGVSGKTSHHITQQRHNPVLKQMPPPSSLSVTYCMHKAWNAIWNEQVVFWTAAELVYCRLKAKEKGRLMSQNLRS